MRTLDLQVPGIHPKTPRKITILGGGPAGLAVGYYGRLTGIPFQIFEASPQVGGGCRTLRHQDFRFDLGAHRLHDKDPEVTHQLQTLIGPSLRKIDVPSQIYSQGRFIDFPLSPLNLLGNLGATTSLKAGAEVLRSKLTGRQTSRDFQDFALKTYGKTIASRFLLNYSEKLWGLPCSQLSPRISGSRLKGLTLKTFVKEMTRSNRFKTEHLDGSFYYPSTGIGTIPDQLAEFCGEDHIICNARVTRVIHRASRITAIEINQDQIIDVEQVVNTLPLSLFLQILDPQPPEAMMKLARSLRYRSLILVAVFLNKPSVTPNASVYFPEPEHLFTRVYEPRNRSQEMSPKGMTSLVAEIPCQQDDPLWQQNDSDLNQTVIDAFQRIGWVKPGEVIDSVTYRIGYAYPVLEVGFEQKIDQILHYINGFKNLRISGRNGKFLYTHIHNMMQFGREIIQAHCQTIAD